eukprot:TRINITY_DN3802_c0_g1_i2.p1 TRINITY_DN3802_c0_g1~~TRINITY_DN3802_c0_g1_i2.p1  ORF type:complete len:916 (+),score=150.01 TRINITY_DN3802_c0_g1_i2:184-2931(+)
MRCWPFLRALLLAASNLVLCAGICDVYLRRGPAMLCRICFTFGFFSSKRKDADDRRTNVCDGPSKSDYVGYFRTARTASCYCAGALVITALVAGKQRRQRASRLIQRAVRKACHTVVQMTPGGQHLARMFPATPSLVRLRSASWPALTLPKRIVTRAYNSVGTDSKKCSVGFSSAEEMPMKRCVTLPPAVFASSPSPNAQLLRNEKRKRSWKGWTPSPLLTPGGTPHREVQLASTNVPARGVDVPSLLELGRIFDTLPTEPDGSVGLTSMVAAIHELNERYGIDLHRGDGTRLVSLLTRFGSSITRQSFSTGMHELLAVFKRVRPQLTIGQLRVVMASAFDRFDIDGDGHISSEEFAYALQAAGVELTVQETIVLHQFLAAGESNAGPAPLIERMHLSTMDSHTVSFEEQCVAAIEGATEHIKRASGLEGVSELMQRVDAALQQPGTISEKAARGFAAACGEDHALLADATEMATHLAGIALVLLNLHMHGPDSGSASADICAQVTESMQDLSSAVGDLIQSGPFGPLLLTGILGAAKAMPERELVSLSEDEALLFARIAHGRGYSQGLFQKLLSCGACRWGVVQPGESLLGTSGRNSELKIVVKGCVQISLQNPGNCGTATIRVPPGLSLGATHFLQGQSLWLEGDSVVAAEPVTYVAWNREELQDYLAKARDPNLNSLVHQLLDDGLDMGNAALEQLMDCRGDMLDVVTPLASHAADESPKGFGRQHSNGQSSSGADGTSSSNGWLSPLTAALKWSADRKGLSGCALLADGLRRVVAKPGASLREKSDQCMALIWDSAEEVKESLVAGIDLAGSCSALCAIYQELSDASAPTADDLLQLGPSLILLSLAASHAAQKCSRVDKDAAAVSLRKEELPERDAAQLASLRQKAAKLLRMRCPVQPPDSSADREDSFA